MKISDVPSRELAAAFHGRRLPGKFTAHFTRLRPIGNIQPKVEECNPVKPPRVFAFAARRTDRSGIYAEPHDPTRPCTEPVRRRDFIGCMIFRFDAGKSRQLEGGEQISEGVSRGVLTPKLVARTGVEPVIFALKGRRVNHYSTGPQGRARRALRFGILAYSLGREFRVDSRRLGVKNRELPVRRTVFTSHESPTTSHQSPVTTCGRYAPRARPFESLPACLRSIAWDRR